MKGGTSFIKGALQSKVLRSRTCWKKSTGPKPETVQRDQPDSRPETKRCILGGSLQDHIGQLRGAGTVELTMPCSWRSWYSRCRCGMMYTGEHRWFLSPRIATALPRMYFISCHIFYSSYNMKQDPNPYRARSILHASHPLTLSSTQGLQAILDLCQRRTGRVTAKLIPSRSKGKHKGLDPTIPCDRG